MFSDYYGNPVVSHQGHSPRRTGRGPTSYAPQSMSPGYSASRQEAISRSTGQLTTKQTHISTTVSRYTEKQSSASQVKQTNSIQSTTTSSLSNTFQNLQVSTKSQSDSSTSDRSVNSPGGQRVTPGQPVSSQFIYQNVPEIRQAQSRSLQTAAAQQIRPSSNQEHVVYSQPRSQPQNVVACFQPGAQQDDTSLHNTRRQQEDSVASISAQARYPQFDIARSQPAENLIRPYARQQVQENHVSANARTRHETLMLIQNRLQQHEITSQMRGQEHVVQSHLQQQFTENVHNHAVHKQGDVSTAYAPSRQHQPEQVVYDVMPKVYNYQQNETATHSQSAKESKYNIFIMNCYN